MRYCILLFLSFVLLSSCERWKTKGVTTCVQIEEVPSTLLNQFSKKTADSATKLSIQLYAGDDDYYAEYEFTRYKVTSPKDSIYYGFFNDHGFITLELPEGKYEIEIKTTEMVNTKLDTVDVLPQFETSLEVKLGTPRGFMTVKER